MAVSRQWWLCCYPGRQQVLEAPWGSTHHHHPAHHCLPVPAPCGPTAAAIQQLLKHPQSLICFTMAHGNTILYVYKQTKSLGYLIILTLGSGAPAEAEGNKYFSLPFLIYLPPTSTVAKGCIVQKQCKISSIGFMEKSS